MQPVVRINLSLILVATLAVLAGPVWPVWGQGETGQSEAGEAAGAIGFDPAVRDEVELRIVKVGPGGRTRAGDWGGVLVEFRDSALEPREILIRLRGFDRDGDDPMYDRVVVGDPERARGVWLYGVMPHPFAASRKMVTAHEALEGGDDGGTGFRAGRVLGRAWIQTNGLVPAESGLMGVIGTRDLGLRQYGTSIQAGVESLPLGHERTEVASGLTIADIPDRWQGLKPYSVLVWSRGGAETDPTALGAEQAGAIREWVRRGGHLVVALPPIGQEWLATARNPLADLLPSARIERREGVRLEPYRVFLTLDREADLPSSGVVHVLTPLAGAPRSEAMPILAGPDGGCVVMRRVVGSGMVTLVGLDLAGGNLDASGALDAEALWHRVLGRRHSLETFQEVKDRREDLASAIQNRVVTDYDADFESSIDRTGDSTTGVLLSLVVFGLYWLLAGPLGFAVLSKVGKRAHAWVAYIGAGVVFTAVAWIGASALRPRLVEGTHLTFLTAVHGTGTHHAEGWMSVLIPSYGRATISVEDDGLISPWTPPPPSGGGGGFPDNREYSLSARRPSEMSPPVRSTIKQIRLDWSGAPRWDLPRPAGEPGDVEPPGLKLVDAENAVVEGDLIHGLPGALEDVLVVVVTRQRTLPSGSIGPLWTPSLIFMDKPALDRWEPGTRLSLGAVTGSATRTRMERDGLTWLRDAGKIGKSRGLGADGLLTTGDAPERFTAMSLFQMLEAPDFVNLQGGGRLIPLAARREGHGLDLSGWLTQPCVIVIGHLVQGEPVASPIPVSVDGETVPSAGRTVVRWVYPLEPSPPGFSDSDERSPVLPGGPEGDSP